MKKNGISAFENKKVAIEAINGGYHFQGTSSDGGRTRTDSELITEKGEDDQSGNGTTAPYQAVDGKCTY